jgi:hypothetical protein
MRNIKIKLLDNGYTARSEINLSIDEEKDSLIKLIQQIKEEFVEGETVYFEIEGIEKIPPAFEMIYYGDPLVHETTGRRVSSQRLSLVA